MSNRTTSAETTRSAASRLVRFWIWLVALGGAALVAVAAAEIVGGEADSGASWLLLAGGILAVGPILFDRLTRLSVGPAGLRFDLSLEIESLGARDTAVRIDEWGGGLAEAAHAYASAHTVLAGADMRDARIRLQDHFVEAAAASALVQQYDAPEVRRLFREGPPVVRVLVLGLMLGDQSLADVETIVSAVTDSRTANEQYQGLRLAERVGRRLSPDDRRRLRDAIEGEPIPPGGHDRTQLRAAVLVQLADVAGDDAGEEHSSPDPAAPPPGRAGARRRRDRGGETVAS
jgi:hypothetical protein